MRNRACVEEKRREGEEKRRVVGANVLWSHVILLAAHGI